MRKFLISTILPSLLLMNSISVFASDTLNSIRFNFKNGTYHHVSMRCGNSDHPGIWMNSGNFSVRPSRFISNPRKLEYVCAIALHNRGEKEVFKINPSEFNSSLRSSQVLLIIEGVDTKARCPKRNEDHHPAEILYSLAVDGKLIKTYESICF